MLTIAGTGHRPQKLGGFSERVRAKLYLLAVEQLVALSPDRVISGMALGWDQALAEAARDLGFPWAAYVPFVGQESQWPEDSQRRYHALLERASGVVICSPGEYMPYKMQIRNERMVDDAGKILALWDGSSGGTANCVVYAMSKKKPVVNCWQRWTELRGGY